MVNGSLFGSLVGIHIARKANAGRFVLFIASFCSAFFSFGLGYIVWFIDQRTQSHFILLAACILTGLASGLLYFAIEQYVMKNAKAA